MRNRPRVLFVTGAYAPEFSAGGLQCQAVARFLDGRAAVEVLTTATTPSLPRRERVADVPVTRILVDRARRWSAIGATARMASALARLLPRADVVHVQGFSSKNVLLTALARLFRRPLILHLQTARHDEPAAIRAQGPLAWWAFTSADRYIAVSGNLSRSYREAGLPADRLLEIPNGVDVARFQPASETDRQALRQRLGLPAGRPVILFVGVISHDKQPHVLLEAWSCLEAEGLESTLLFVGATDPRLFELEGRLAEQMQATLSRLPGADRVRFIAPTPQVENYYRAADVLVMPSVREGLPNVVLEAMACGLPVIASRLSGSTDTMIDDGINGRLVPAGDAAAFAAAIGEVLRDGAHAARLGQAARRTAEERYAIERIADQWFEAYHRVLTPAGPTAR